MCLKSFLDKQTCCLLAFYQGIVNRFTNYFNSTIKKNLITRGDATESSESAEADKLLCTFALLSNDLSGREYYARKHAQLVKERTQAIFKGQHNISETAARKKALSQLWDDMVSSEKNHWKECAEEYAMNIAK